MLLVVAPPVRTPVNVAPVIVTGGEVTKSSAASISILPAEDGREAAPIRLFGTPVLNVNGIPGPADAGSARTASTAEKATRNERITTLEDVSTFSPPSGRSPRTLSAVVRDYNANACQSPASIS